MDSMRSLNSSLPRNSSPSGKSSNPPEKLLQAFKAAALSVTNLYKTAASEQAQSRAAGYQDALEDLLSYLDKENIGVVDSSEGQRVRQWISERISNNRLPGNQTADSDEDGDEEKRARSSSPVLQRKSSREESLRDVSGAISISPRPESTPRTTIVHSSVPRRRTECSPPVADFTFRSPATLTSTLDCSIDKPAEIAFIGGQVPHNQPLRVGVLPRLPRSARQNGHPNRAQSRSAGSAASLGPASGTKRRLPFGDYFDLGGLAKDNNSKRGRHF